MAKAINVSEQRQRVIHLIPDARFEDGEHVWRQSHAQSMRAKRSKRHAGEPRDRSQQ